MRIIHHRPDCRSLREAETDAEKAHFRRINAEYRDASRPAIHVCGTDDVIPVLTDHPRIRFLANLFRRDGEEAGFREAGHPDLRIGFFPIGDIDQRAYGLGNNPPSEENVKPLIGFLKEWIDAGNGAERPSLMVRCSQGQYRSAAAGLIARTMLTGDPLESAHALVEADRGIDCNWEIARHADRLLGLDGTLHRAAVNTEEALARRRHMLNLNLSDSEIHRVTDAVLRQPVGTAPSKTSKPEILRACRKGIIEDGLPGKDILTVRSEDGRDKWSWSSWMDLPSKSFLGTYLAAPVCSGLYELRQYITLTPVACGWSASLVCDLAALCGRNGGYELFPNSRLHPDVIRYVKKNSVQFRCWANDRDPPDDSRWREFERLRGRNAWMFPPVPPDTDSMPEWYGG